jgi:DNA-binding Xre family transcriptional regulator
MSLIDVHILNIGRNKLGVVMALKAALGSDLRTAKALAEQEAPSCVAKYLPWDKAGKMKHALESAGATVSFSNSTVTPVVEKPLAEEVQVDVYLPDTSSDSTMAFDTWARKVEKEQGVTLEEAMESMGLPEADLKKWERDGKVPEVAVKFLSGLADEIDDAIDEAP